jgi:hypothetical protein
MNPAPVAAGKSTSVAAGGESPPRVARFFLSPTSPNRADVRGSPVILIPKPFLPEPREVVDGLLMGGFGKAISSLTQLAPSLLSQPQRPRLRTMNSQPIGKIRRRIVTDPHRKPSAAPSS